MYNRKYLAGATLAALLLAAPLAARADATLSNTNDNGSIGPIGHAGQADELGEVFTAPVSGTLDSFTFTFTGPVSQYTVGIGEWNGPASYTQGFGVSAVDYQSGVMTAPGPGDVTFDPNVAVTAGLQYVAFVSTFGLTKGSDQNGLAISLTPTTNIDYIVFNYGDPGASAWDYFQNYDPSQITMSAHFTTPNPCNADHPLACGPGGGVPEPDAWALMILGFGGAGAALRRRRRTIATAA